MLGKGRKQEAIMGIYSSTVDVREKTGNPHQEPYVGDLRPKEKKKGH